MTEGAWVAIMTGLPATIAAIGALIVALRNGVQVTKNTAAVEGVHKATNSIKDELVAATRVAALAEGVIRGAAEERARNAPAAPRPLTERELGIAEGIRQERARVAALSPTPTRDSPL